MRLLTRTLGAATALVLAATTAAAQVKTPDLSGTWELDAAKSDFGPMQAPAKMTLTITQGGAAKMKIVTVTPGPNGDQSVATDYPVDGAPHDITTSDGAKQTSTTKWDGSTFVVDTKMERQGMNVGIVSRFDLTPDGKILTVARHITTPQGDADLKIEFNKK